MESVSDAYKQLNPTNTRPTSPDAQFMVTLTAAGQATSSFEDD